MELKASDKKKDTGLSACLGACCCEFLCKLEGEWSGVAIESKLGAAFAVKGKSPGDAPASACFSKKLKSGDYFEVKVVDLHKPGGCFLGVATGDAFRAATKALTPAARPQTVVEIFDREFEVVLDRSRGQKLGINVDLDQLSLVVRGITSGGIVEAWNTNYDGNGINAQAVSIDDRIFEVNGIRGDSELLYSELEQEKLMLVKIRGARQEQALKCTNCGRNARITDTFCEHCGYKQSAPMKAQSQPWVKGLFFSGDGNLTDGSSLVTKGFGDQVVKGDVIGMRYDVCKIAAPRQEELVTLTLYHNDRCLGPAFVSSKAPGVQVFPVVRAQSEGDRFLCRFRYPPVVRSRQTKAGRREPAEGAWVLRHVFTGPDRGEYPLASKLTSQSSAPSLRVEAMGPEQVLLKLRCCNTVEFEASSKCIPAEAPFDEFKVLGATKQSQSWGPKPLMELESLLIDWIQKIDKWCVHASTLTMQGPTVVLELQAAGGVFQPAEDILLE